MMSPLETRSMYLASVTVTATLITFAKFWGRVDRRLEWGHGFHVLGDLHAAREKSECESDLSLFLLPEKLKAIHVFDFGNKQRLSLSPSLFWSLARSMSFLKVLFQNDTISFKNELSIWRIAKKFQLWHYQKWKTKKWKTKIHTKKTGTLQISNLDTLTT